MSSTIQALISPGTIAQISRSSKHGQIAHCDPTIMTMKLADRPSALPTTSFRFCAFYCDHQVTALVYLALQDANIRYFQWNCYLGFAHRLVLSRFSCHFTPPDVGATTPIPNEPLKLAKQIETGIE